MLVALTFLIYKIKLKAEWYQCPRHNIFWSQLECSYVTHYPSSCNHLEERGWKPNKNYSFLNLAFLLPLQLKCRHPDRKTENLKQRKQQPIYFLQQIPLDPLFMWCQASSFFLFVEDPGKGEGKRGERCQKYITHILCDFSWEDMSKHLFVPHWENINNRAKN